jgi:hypothetical protein
MSIVSGCHIWRNPGETKRLPVAYEMIEVGHFELIDPRSSEWPVVKELLLELGEGELDDNASAK